MPVDVREVANTVLEIADREHFGVTNLSLNKIIFFAHAWYLACYGEPLIDSPFEAWQYGPVHPQIHRQLKRFKDRRVTAMLTRIDANTGDDILIVPSLTSAQKEMVEKVTRFYGRHSAARLVEISHESGAPWDQVWQAANGKSSPGMVIPDEMIKKFYQRKLQDRS